MRLFYQYRRAAAAVIFLLAAAGGATALAHQLLWTRRMVDLMGASAGSAARVFGCFFFGLAVGSFLGAWLAPRVQRPWRWLASAELLIAFLCLPMLFLNDWTAGLWPWLGPERLTGWMGGSLKTVFSIGLVFPPAVVMGLFLPLAVIGWPQTEYKQDPGVWLYAVNTLGAVLGILLVTAWLLPLLGMQRVMMAAIFANLLAAAGGFLLDAGGCGWRPTPVTMQGIDWRATIPPRSFLLLAALSGGLVMACEVIALLVVQLLAPLSFFAPAAVLGAFILLLAAGAFVVAAGSRSGRFTHESSLVPIALWAGVVLAFTPLLFHFLAPRFPLAVEQTSLLLFLLRLSGFTLLVFGPATLVAALWFPTMAMCCGDRNKTLAPYRWGWLLATNGVGGWMGTELAYGVILPWVGPFTGLGLIGLFYMIAAWVLQPVASKAGVGDVESSRSLSRTPGTEPRPTNIECRPTLCGRRMDVWMIRIGLAVALGLFWFVHPSLPTVHPQFMPHVLEQKQGREGSLAVLESPEMGRALLLQNQYILGSTQAALQQERQAHLPLLLHPQPRNVGFIGLATGSTAGAALLHGAVETVDIAEISQTVVDAAVEWFAEANRDITQDPRARVVVEDGRTWVAAHENAFDVLVSDLFLPWGPGEGRLYTLEHFEAAHRAIRSDGGLFCLWLPMYQLTDPQFMVILNTFLQVFDRAELLKWDHQEGQPAIAIIGWKAATDFGVDADVWRHRIAAEQSHIGDRQLLAEEYFETLYIGTAERGLIRSPLNTLANLWIELDAGRTRVLHPQTAPYLAGPRWRSWLESLRAGLEQGGQD